MLNKYTICLILLLSPALVYAQDSVVFLSPKLTNKGKNLSLEVASDATLSGCSLSIFASDKKRILAEDSELGVLVSVKDEFNGELVLLAGGLPNLREITRRLNGRTVTDKSKVNLFFRSKVICPDVEYQSDTERVRLSRSGKRGPKNVRAWIENLKKQVVKGQIKATQVFSALSFDSPVDLQRPPGNSGKLFVVEQAGRVISFDNRPDVSASTVFLDIKDRVLFNGEQGLLGLAFHPQFSQNGFIYVNYINKQGNTVIARYTSQGKASGTADSTTELQLFTVEQPFTNHNGGQLAFGPDGFLYIAMGDGGSGGDPLGNGQKKTTLLGKILRINVDATDAGKNYSVPSSNPFFGSTDGSLGEIFAYGLRNPWRISFDSQSGDLWAGDVGQDAREEVDIIVKGGNYGWNIQEGEVCYSPPSNCSSEGLIDPIVDYSHSLGQSITGGYVYRGSLLSSLTGFYIYADFITGRIWAVKKQGSSVLNTELLKTDYAISSFGLDDSSEVYFFDYSSGKIYKLTS